MRLELVAPKRASLSVNETADPRDPSTSHPELDPGFIAYSASGDVTAPIVYVNYGLPADYARLQAAGIDVRGRIVLARYARSHRAVKVHTAEQAGASAVILYNDPADDGFTRGEVWPKACGGPRIVLQRGNAKYSWFWHGDPLTPGVAATVNQPALDPANAPTLPKIPVVVLAATEAEKILRRLSGRRRPRGLSGRSAVHLLRRSGTCGCTSPRRDGSRTKADSQRHRSSRGHSTAGPLGRLRHASRRVDLRRDRSGIERRGHAGSGARARRGAPCRLATGAERLVLFLGR